MKSYNGLFDKMLTEESLNIAFHDAAKSKRKRRDVQSVMRNLEDVELSNGMTKLGHKHKLHDILDEERLVLIPHDSCRINEATCQKERDIVKPYFKYEQVVHHLLVGQFKPIVMAGFYEYSCGSIPDRGCHFGKKHLERWIAQYPADTPLYVLKMDIRHFFESVDHDILKRMLERVIRDKKYLRLMFQVIDCHTPGLPLGYYTSQWLANFYLKDFDHYVKEVLGAEHYMRYMDDMVVLGASKEDLHRIRAAISKYLEEVLNVELKGNWQVFPLAYDAKDRHGRALDYMGFKFYRNCTTLRKSILFRARRKANKIDKKGTTKTTWRDATSMISYMGWIFHTNTYGYYAKYIKPKVSLSILKLKVAQHSRKELKKEHDRVEESSRHPARSPRRGRWLFQYEHCVPAQECSSGGGRRPRGRRTHQDVGVRRAGDDPRRVQPVQNAG